MSSTSVHAILAVLITFRAKETGLFRVTLNIESVLDDCAHCFVETLLPFRLIYLNDLTPMVWLRWPQYFRRPSGLQCLCARRLYRSGYQLTRPKPKLSEYARTLPYVIGVSRTHAASIVFRINA